MSLVVVDNLIKAYGDLNVLSYISFMVDKGEIVTFLGPSGSGKSSLLRCITGIDNDFKGEIKIEGKSQIEYFRKSRISLVTQNYGNYPWLNVKENIQLGIKANQNQGEIKLDEIIDIVELTKFESFYPSQLSGGMQQRVAIGRSIAQNTDIVAMDEPFGALDHMTRTSIQQIFKNICEKLNKTILFVTHDVEEAIFLSDRIIILSKQPTVIASEIKVPLELRKSTDKSVRYSAPFIKLKIEIENILSSLNSLTFVKDIFGSKNFEKLTQLNYWNTFLVNECRRLYRNLSFAEQEALSTSLLNTDNTNSVIIGSLLNTDIDSHNIKSKLQELINQNTENTDFTLMYFLIHAITNIKSTDEEKEYYLNIVLKNINAYTECERRYFTAEYLLSDSIILKIIESRFFGKDSIVNLENKGWLLLVSSLSHPNKEDVNVFLYKFVTDNSVFMKETALKLLDITTHKND